MSASPTELLTPLVYELLDAHRDTVELADELADEPWRAHLDYLRTLQRKGRELLAQADAAKGDSVERRP
jgi:hypothetical protein